MFNIYHDIEIKASNTSIYEAITKPSGLNSWWTLKSKGEATIGECYQFYFSDDYNWFAQLVHLNQNNLVQFKMVDADVDWMDTILTFSITNMENNKSLLSFSHEGWKDNNPHFRRTSFCWALYLSGLKEYLEKGIVIEYSKRGSK